jgi:hypothetical protein
LVAEHGRLKAAGRSVSGEDAEQTVHDFGGFRGKRQKGFLFHDPGKSQPIGGADLVFSFTGGAIGYFQKPDRPGFSKSGNAFSHVGSNRNGCPANPGSEAEPFLFGKRDGGFVNEIGGLVGQFKCSEFLRDRAWPDPPALRLKSPA